MIVAPPNNTLHLHPDCKALLSDAAPVLLGLSGGRDSVALLHLLVEQGCCVVARHLNHGIRGDEAEGDAEFCRALCLDLGVDFAQEHAHIPHMAQQSGESLELCARRVRRAYLIEQARLNKCSSIALAQHADDQAETILFRLARGAAGLRGMEVCSEFEGITLLRPLLHCRRSDITAYLQNKGQAWRDDASNDSSEHTRNALRHDVLPAYTQAMGRDIVPIINRSAALQSDVTLALQNALELLQGHFYDPQGRLYLPALNKATPELARAVLQHYLHAQGIPDISTKLLLEIEAIFDPNSPCSCVNLPSGKQLKRAHQRLFIASPLAK